MNIRRQSPGLFSRLWVLCQTYNRARWTTALYTLRKQGARVLYQTVLMHTSFRWRILNGLPAESYYAGADPLVGKRFEPYTVEPLSLDTPLVSVVIPCFNYGAYVAAAVDSVLAQTLQDVEIIVVEGGSTDGVTPGLLRAFERPRTRVLFRDEPHRVGDNRNFGISHAKGRFICCLDADDMLTPTYLEKAVFLMEYGAYDVVSSSVRRFGAKDGIDNAYYVMPIVTLAILLRHNQVTTAAVFRRDLWERSGGYEDSAPNTPHLHEDWRFWIRLAAEGARIRNMHNDLLFLYRAHATPSLSNAPDVLSYAEQGAIIQELESSRITKSAIARSDNNAKRRYRATNGPLTLLDRAKNAPRQKTILLAVPWLVLGGAERLLSEVLRHMRGAGYRFVVVSTLSTAPEQGDTTDWFEPATDEIYHLPRFLAVDEWGDFIDYIMVAKKVDALWIVGSALFYEALPDLTQRYPALRVVDLLFNTIGHTTNNRRYAQWIDYNLVESDEVRQWLLAHGALAEHVQVIPSGIDVMRYRPALRSRAMAETIGIGADCFIVGYSGRLSEEKAPLACLAIAQRLAAIDDIRLVITGGGPLESDLRAGIAAARPEGRIHFLGIVPEVRDWLACYDVLILPSEFDGRPTVVLEAMAMGIPVIASAVGSVLDLVRDGETGFLCKPGDCAAFADAILRIRSDPALAARMGTAARVVAERDLGLERMADAYAAVFDSLLAPPAG